MNSTIQKEHTTTNCNEEEKEDDDLPPSLSLDSIELVWKEDIQDQEDELENESHIIVYASVEL